MNNGDMHVLQMEVASLRKENSNSHRESSTSTDSSGKEEDEATNQYRHGKSSAVRVNNATKYYGRKGNKTIVLDELNLSVPHGSIYGLLGPSGCGKTTLLGCLVSRLKLDKGDIFIFGFPPGSDEAAVPGSRVGYMPQDIALYKEFTIAETLKYFGRIHGLSKGRIEERTQFLVTFLDLPNPKRIITQLSGGQQRRVSLAAALLQEPELLILDEPTVGVDPLLRTSIWNHLLTVSSGGNTTIIITTHYIDEARQADRVGLMRRGKLLAETSPEKLLEHFKLKSLETVFLKLCMEEGDAQDKEQDSKGHINVSFAEEADSKINKRRTTVAEETPEDLADETLFSGLEKTLYVSPWSDSRKPSSMSFSRYTALFIKNILTLRRNLGFLLFAFLLPPVTTVLFCVAIGGVPQDLDMAVVNLDEPRVANFKISDIFLENIDTDIIVQKEYASFSSGYARVEDGSHWGLIFFNTTYTEKILSELFGLNYPNGDGYIHLYMDNTNQQISFTIQLELYRALEKTLRDLMEILPITNNTNLGLPIQIEKPVYGDSDPTFTEFMAPGIITTLCYFMAVSLTALSLIIERKEGLLDRSWVSGVLIAEVMLSHLSTQMMVMLIQITLILTFIFAVFDIPCEGSLALVVLMAIIQGLSGMTFGFMVSALFDDELTAIEITVGALYPLLLLSGIVWPLEAMPPALRYISYILPQTLACESLRAIMYRGWGMTYFEVYIGYIVPSIWSVFNLIVAAVGIKIRK